MSEIFHVYPTLDEREHDTDKGAGCHCKPRIQTFENGNTLVTHNAYDCREFIEEAEAIKADPDAYL